MRTLRVAVALSLLAASGYGEVRVSFRRWSVDRGLSHRAVYSVAQDAQGFLWIATQAGLIRFDGDRFDVFGEDPSDPASIGVEDVSSLLPLADGRLWIGTWGGG